MVDSAHGMWVAAVGSLHLHFQWHLGTMDTANTNLSQDNMCLPKPGDGAATSSLLAAKNSTHKTMDWIEIHLHQWEKPESYPNLVTVFPQLVLLPFVQF